jgi:hypothetical protein
LALEITLIWTSLDTLTLIWIYLDTLTLLSLGWNFIAYHFEWSTTTSLPVRFGRAVLELHTLTRSYGTVFSVETLI